MKVLGDLGNEDAKLEVAVLQTAPFNCGCVISSNSCAKQFCQSSPC